MNTGGIEYTWDTEDTGISREHQDILRMEALERATEMVAQGYIEGELCTMLPDEDEETRGWWRIK